MIYVDLLVIQDLVYNYVILFGVSILLVRITNFKKIFLSSVIGTVPLIFLFLNMSNLFLILILFIFSFIMSIISFSYKNILYTIKNILYMYMVGIFMGGAINLININFLPNVNSYILNILILIILAPVVTIVYVFCIKSIKNNYSNYYKVDIYLKSGSKISVSAFLDTGNKLIDPYKKRPIILVRESLIDIENMKILLVPFNTVNNNDLLKCVVPEKIVIDGIGVKTNFLIGLMDEVNIEGVDCILNQKLLERI